MDINSIGDFRRAMRTGGYAWPGGYPLYFIMEDGESLSFKAARENVRPILEAILNHMQDRTAPDGWRVVAVEVNWEDEHLYCAHSGERIESAYGGEDEDEDEDGDRPACQVLGGPHHRDSGRGVCIDCGEFLPTADGDYWK